MKQILNTPAVLIVNDKPHEINYAYLISQVAMFQEGGVTTKDVRERSRILDAVKDGKTEDNIDMEDSDFENLKVLIPKMKWAFISKVFIEFEDYILTIK